MLMPGSSTDVGGLMRKNLPSKDEKKAERNQNPHLNVDYAFFKRGALTVGKSQQTHEIVIGWMTTLA